MATFKKTVLTKSGEELVARSLAGEKLIFTRVCLGSGVKAENQEEILDLVKSEVEGGIVRLEQQSDTVKLTATIINASVEEEFLNTELGVYAKIDGDDSDKLYSYTLADKADWIANNQLGTSLELELNIYLQVDGSIQTNYEINESISYLTTQLADEKYVKRVEVVDNLTTVDGGKPLSAKQGKVLNDRIANLEYAVGDIYLTLSETHPSIRWPGTTWKRITDKFLIGGGETYPIGSTGGVNTQKLTTAHLPSHNHTGSGKTDISGNHYHGVHPHRHRVENHAHGTPAHDHALFTRGYSTQALIHYGRKPVAISAHLRNTSDRDDYSMAYYEANPSVGVSEAVAPVTNGSSPYTNSISTSTYYSGNHTHNFNLTTNHTGSGQEFSILNPYLAVNIWQRLS